MSYTTNIEKTMTHLHKQGAFLTVKNGETVNTMTISWGNIGFEWNRPIFTVLVRKSRFTHELIEKATEFSVSVPLSNRLKQALAVCGTKSGRDIDKFQASGLTLKAGESIATPSIEGCEMVYECKIVYKQDMDPNFLSEDIQAKMYGDHDYHTIYYGEIVKVIAI